MTLAERKLDHVRTWVELVAAAESMSILAPDSVLNKCSTVMDDIPMSVPLAIP